MSQTSRLFAADYGASGGKCFVGILKDGEFKLEEVHRFAHEGVTFFIQSPDGELSERTYWDDVLLYHNLVEGLRVYRREVADTIDSIGIDTWGADGQFIAPNGEMMGKVYAYRDHRLDNMVEVVKQKVSAEELYGITGIHFQPFNLSNQLHWFVKNRPELMLDGVRFFPIPSLFYYYLGGIWKVDSTWASVTQLMDARTQQWSDSILEKLDIPRAVLPEIVKPGEKIGELLAPIAQETGLNRAPLMAVGSHDTASAFAAAPLSNPDKAMIISSGTWSLVGKLIPEPITSPKAMQANMSNEGGIDNVRFLKNCMGAWLVQELRRIWRIADGKEMTWEEITALTEQGKPFTAFIDVNDPIFYNPSNMEEAICAFLKRTNQPVPEDRPTMLRLVAESLALSYRLINETICDICGVDNEIIAIVGGGCKNALLNQFTANATGLPVQTGPEEATAVGNLMVQALGLGLIDSLVDAQGLIRSGFAIRRYEPQDSDGKWAAAWEKFRQIASM
ncbi:MAG: rhamnulokinase [Candidatus Sumerlaeia bacterium]